MAAKTLTDTNLRVLLAVLKGPRERAMVLLSLKAGLRAVEIAGLTWGRLREDDNLIELVATKGGRPRTVPVNKELREALRAWRLAYPHTDDTDHVFVSRHAKPGTPLSANAVAQWFRDLYVRRLGWAGYSSHSGRRTFATNAARKATLAGGSLKDVQDMLGHANLNTTQRYLEPSSDAKRRLVDMV